MSRSVPLSTLRTRVYRLVDGENATGRFPTAEVDDAINEAICDTYEKIIASGGLFIESVTSPANTTQGTDVYALASDVFQITRVRMTISGVGANLTRFERMTDDAYEDYAGGQGPPEKFAVIGDNLVFRPVPDGAYSFIYNYAKRPTTLVAAGDSFDGINGWEEHSVLGAGRRLARKNKEWELLSRIDADLMREDRRITNAGLRRNPLPPKMINVDGMERRARRRWFYR